MIMKNSDGAANSHGYSQLREQFLARFMAAQTKHRKPIRRKKHRVVRPARASNVPKPPSHPVLQPPRPLVKPEDPPQEELLHRDDEEPKPEDLAKEEATVKEV